MPAGVYNGAASRIQRTFRASRRRSSQSRGATVRSQRSSGYIPSRVPGYLRVKGTKAFQMTVAPFALALGQGTAGTQGIAFYPIAGVPSAPAYINTQRFGLSFQLGGVIPTLNGVVGSGFSLTNYNEYTLLFDSYRIRKVEVTMFYNSNSSTLGPGTSLPVISMANDYDDQSATDLSSLQQYDSYRCVQFGNNSTGKIKHSLMPKVQSSIQTSGGGTGYGFTPSGNPWIDCNNSTVNYFGIKGNYDNMNINTGSVGFITFYVKYFVEFKNTR